MLLEVKVREDNATRQSGVRGNKAPTAKYHDDVMAQHKKLTKWEKAPQSWKSIIDRLDTDTGCQSLVGISYMRSMMNSERDRAWCSATDEHLKRWIGQQSNY